MRKPIEDKSPLAAWATLSRESAGMSVEETVSALAERGHAVQAATIRGIEGGSKGASARLRRLMAEVYGVTAPGQKEGGPANGEAGLGALVVALSGFVDELREDRRIRQEQIGALLQSIQEDRMARAEWEQGFLGAMLELATIATRQDGPRDELPAGAPAHAVR